MQYIVTCAADMYS